MTLILALIMPSTTASPLNLHLFNGYILPPQHSFTSPFVELKMKLIKASTQRKVLLIIVNIHDKE